MDPTFTELYRLHYPAVLRFVRRRAHPAAVDDVVSETFVAAWRRQDEMLVAPLPWLYRTARNVMLNAARSAGRRTGLAVRVQGEASVAVPSDDPIAALERRHDLALAWRSLDELDQEALALQVWEGMTGAQAAAVLGISRAAYSMRASRARRRLAAVLRDSDEGERRGSSTAPAAATHPDTGREAQPPAAIWPTPDTGREAPHPFASWPTPDADPGPDHPDSPTAMTALRLDRKARR
ncbi:sigma-70 family RNA polymerase sigma factor [Curtobacterium sp. MCBD17_013]|uniref:RNA polymerase sigma factor n=1 Tax=unclassified Curtobacterium TaxID=257496 RepID=UPI000DA9F919|nr:MULTISPECIES: sigma-70 family RNA polymerase sigma factor [unclassified Curtobacterium]PZF66131.1 sigma-70 family RNA polymerase sigma factor [Curtobacterium sp. MCBD17_013]WIB68508.1 sigma-70 family RNA polymerase sigma factor [Curtobacterium sp. MCBD17_035]